MNRTMLFVCGGLAVIALAAAAQRRGPGTTSRARPTVGVTIALKAGGEAYQYSGQASCTHAPTASIYGVVAEQWVVQQSEGARSVQLTLWKPKNASGQMFSLSLTSGATSQSVNTVTAPGAPPRLGSGTVTLAPAGAGGTFTVTATDANGKAIAGTIKCDAFLPAIAEGGE